MQKDTHELVYLFMDHTPKDVCHNKGGYLNRVSVGRSTAFGMIQWRVNPFDGTPFYQFKGFRNCSLTRRYTYICRDGYVVSLSVGHNYTFNLNSIVGEGNPVG